MKSNTSRWRDVSWARDMVGVPRWVRERRLISGRRRRNGRDPRCRPGPELMIYVRTWSIAFVQELWIGPQLRAARRWATAGQGAGLGGPAADATSPGGSGTVWLSKKVAGVESSSPQRFAWGLRCAATPATQYLDQPGPLPWVGGH